MFPPGQQARVDFPRFGLPPYAKRFPTEIDARIVAIEVNGENKSSIDIGACEFNRIQVKSDFHCVTTWSYVGANWSGVRFAEFYEKYVSHLVDQNKPIVGAILCAQDGYRTSLILEDLMMEGVVLADSLNSQPLSVEHGAPLRLIAPAHYGYKNLKHLKRIEFFTDLPVVKRGFRAFLDHPRARVKEEERGRWIPGWILRYVYRTLITSTAKEFSDGMRLYRKNDV